MPDPATHPMSQAGTRTKPLSATGRLLTSESVAEGHPDKVADLVADSILDAYLEEDSESHVACEVLCKGGHLVLAGEVRSEATVDHDAVVRRAVRAAGYDDPADPFHADGLVVQDLIGTQSDEIDNAVVGEDDRTHEQGAGDQGIIFGYASDETPELMPLPILLAHRLAAGLAADRRANTVPWLRPDGKTQVSVRYVAGRPVDVERIVVSTQHRVGVSREEIAHYVATTLVPRALGERFHAGIEITANPSGSFVRGGPAADCGVTGRKIIVDTYGGAACHGGGAFSGKDPSKVDRSAAYFSRLVARRLVLDGLARRAEIQLGYAIGEPLPVSIAVETFGTGDARAAQDYLGRFDFRPAAMIERLDLKRPIYRDTVNYGHFGRPGFPWEA